MPAVTYLVRILEGQLCDLLSKNFECQLCDLLSENFGRPAMRPT